MATDNRIKPSPSRSKAPPRAVSSELFRILGRFDDALSLAETATRALEMTEAPGTGAVLCTLVQSVVMLRAVYTDLDLTVGRLSTAHS